MWFDLDRCDPDWADQARHRFVQDVILRAPPEAVFATLCDEQAWPRWFPNMRRSTWLTEDPHGVGSLRRADMRGGLSVIEHFTVFRPGARMTFYVERMSLPLVSRFIEDYVMSPHPEGTRLLWTVGYRPRTLLRPLHPLLGPTFARLFRQGAENLDAWMRR